MFHGNLELDSLEVHAARKAMHEGKTTPEVNQQSQLQPYSDRKVHVDIEFKTKAVTMLIRDEGQGFDAVGGLTSANRTSQLSGEGGRGLTLIRKFMDDVQFNSDGNEVKLQRKIGSSPAPKMRANDRMTVR